MAKYRVIIDKYIEDDIEAKTQEEAIDILWEKWLLNDAIISVESCNEENEYFIEEDEEEEE